MCRIHIVDTTMPKPYSTLFAHVCLYLSLVCFVNTTYHDKQSYPGLRSINIRPTISVFSPRCPCSSIRCDISCRARSGSCRWCRSAIHECHDTWFPLRKRSLRFCTSSRDKLAINDIHNTAHKCYIPANIRTEYAQDIGGRTMRRKNGSICALDAIACVRFGFPCGQCTLVLPSLHIAHLQRIIDARMDRIEAIVRFVFL